jgi:hypothetical protein
LGLTLGFLVAFFATNMVLAQETEPMPYNPCISAPTLPAHCIDGTRTCDYYSQFPCSPGYCWEAGGIPINAGIPPSTIVENKTIEIAGVYTITQNVRFNNCIFKMRGDSRINISPISGHNLMKIVFSNCKFFGCGEMWQGIVVDASMAQKKLGMQFVNNSVEDAYIGLTLDPKNGQYGISDNIFRNNHIGISNVLNTSGQEAKLNAVIVRNQFYQTANLATQVGSLINLTLPDFPLAHAGIKFVLVDVVVGVDQHGQQNSFICLVNGIITENSAWESINNFFYDIAEIGIWSKGSRLKSTRCRFYGTGRIGVLTEKVYLTAQLNRFSGVWEEGIHAVGNDNGQQIIINNLNRFDMTGSGWRIGIYVERPQSNFIFTSGIDGNVFTTNSVGAEAMNCITVVDIEDATTEFYISNNTLNISATAGIGGVLGIRGIMGNSDNLNIHDNHIRYITPNTQDYGILLQPNGGQNLSMGHIVRQNDITGISTVQSQFTNPIICCVHARGIQGMDFCENTFDQSVHGFHFLSQNNINVRNNHINNHSIGLEINTGDARIGKQIGHGNEWNLDPNACVLYAASVSNGDPLFSEFVVPEGNVLPWLPPNVKLFPDPSTLFWFYNDATAPLDYCEPMLSPLPRLLTPYEKEVVLGTSSLSGVALWDLTRDVYAKLLIFPALRPTGSPEETFFNSLNGSTLASLANVVQQIRNALIHTSTYESTLATYTTAIDLAFTNLGLFDASMNYTNTSNLTDAWFAQRDTLLLQISVSVAAQAALVNVRNQQINTALQNVLTYNAAIGTTLPYESARKTIQELRIRHLLGQPITQLLYQQALALAQQSVLIIGASANESVYFLAPCDQALFVDMEEGHQQIGERADSGQSIVGIQVAPNPTTGLTEIILPQNAGGLLTVYNISGKKVNTRSFSAETTQLSLDFSQNPTGLYWIVLSDQAGKLIGTAKVSVLH